MEMPDSNINRLIKRGLYLRLGMMWQEKVPYYASLIRATLDGLRGQTAMKIFYTSLLAIE